MTARILVIQLAKLGDFIQSTSLLANIREKWPGAEISLAAEQPGVVEAARLSPLVDRVCPVNESCSSGQSGAQEGRAGESWGRFDRVYVLNSHRRALSLASEVQADHYYGPRQSADEIVFTPAQRFLMAIMRLGRTFGRFNLVDVWASLEPGSRPNPVVWADCRPEIGLSQRLGFKIGLQLGSRNHLRRWPVEKYVELLARLTVPSLGLTPVLLGSSEERALGAKFEKLGREAGLPAPVNLIGSTSLGELGSIVKALDLLITPDTGVMHLAAALSTPVLALFFGPAYGPETGPYGPGHLIYQAQASCAPCLENGPCRRRQCLETPDPAVAATLAGWLLGRGGGGSSQPPAFTQLQPLPAGHRVWQTGADSFGQTLKPWGHPPLTAGEALALIITQAGRNFICPSYQKAEADLAQALSGYGPPENRLKLDHQLLVDLAAQGFGGPHLPGLDFLEAAKHLAYINGLEFA